jgi:acetyl esterase/lipase
MHPRAPRESPSAAASFTRALTWIVGITCVLVLLGKAAIEFSPWPRALLIRWSFDSETKKMSEALAKHVPAGISEQLNEHYDPADPDAFLDVYFPSEMGGSERVLPAVVWVHGGAWVSGNKNDIANYARIVASKGFAVASVNYSIAPEATYPRPVKQVVAALAYLNGNADRLHMDKSKIFLAGDSAGSQIATQVANIISSPAYATTMGMAAPLDRSQLAGVVLYCGPYDVSSLKFESRWGYFPKALLWSYVGKKDFLKDPAIAAMSVAHHVTADFPPTFISVGNDDGLMPQSRAFAETLASLGVEVDSLFFEENHTPRLGHEYQFILDIEEGRLALERSVAFLRKRVEISTVSF